MTTQTRTGTRLLTAADLLRLYSEGVRGELIRGELCKTMAAGRRHGKIVMKLGWMLMNFIMPRGLGELAGSDTGVRLERDPDTVREPDIAFYSTERVPLIGSDEGYYDIIPDIVVEIASPSDSRMAMYDKARMWHSYGARIVWAVYPNTRSVDVHGEDGSITTLTEADTLDGGAVLPGFTCPVRDIFEI